MVAVLVVLMLGKCADCSTTQGCKRWSGQAVMLRLCAMCVLLAGGCVIGAISCAQLHGSAQAVLLAISDNSSSLLAPVALSSRGESKDVQMNDASVSRKYRKTSPTLTAA